MLFVRREVANLQIIINVVCNINIARTIKADNLAIACAGNTTREINLTAAGIHILNNNLIGRRIVVNIQLIYVAAFFTVPDSTAINNLILLACRNHAVTQSAAFISVIDTVNLSLYITSNIGSKITITTLDNAVDVNIRSVDVNITASNIAATSFITISKRCIIVSEIIRTILCAIGIYNILVLLIIFLLRAATNFHNAISVALRDILCSLHCYISSNNSHSVFYVLALDGNAVMCAIDINFAFFSVKVTLDKDIRHRRDRSGNGFVLIGSIVMNRACITDITTAVVAFNSNYAITTSSIHRCILKACAIA